MYYADKPLFKHCTWQPKSFETPDLHQATGIPFSLDYGVNLSPQLPNNQI